LLSQSSLEPAVRILFLTFLAFAAFALAAAALIGVAIKLVLLTAFAVAGLAIVGWLMRKSDQGSRTLLLDRPLEGKRLPR
jgi:hypothetical protein